MVKGSVFLGITTALILPITIMYFFPNEWDLALVSIPFMPILYLLGYNIITEKEGKRIRYP